MNIEIITRNLQLAIYGFGGIAVNKDYVGTAFKLSGKTWEVVKASNLKNKGVNIWVYENADRVFAGVEIEAMSNDHGLEKKEINLERYARHKHIGPYNLIRQTGRDERTDQPGF